MCLISRVMDYYGIKTTDKNLVHTTCLPVCLSAQWPSVPSKIDCKETNGYTAANIKPDLGATTPSTPSMTGWGAGAPVRPAVCTPDMTRYTPSTADQVARDRAWMNTCSSLASQAAPAHVGHLPVPPGDQGQPHLSVKQFTWSRQHCHCSLHHPQVTFHLVHLPPSDWDFKIENAGRRLTSSHLQIPRINLDLDRTKGRDCKLKRFVEEAVHLVDYDLPAAIKPSSPGPS